MPSCASNPQSKKRTFFASPRQSPKPDIQTGKRHTIQFGRMSGNASLTLQSHPKRHLSHHHACCTDTSTLRTILDRGPVITDSGVLRYTLYTSSRVRNRTLGHGSKRVRSGRKQKKGSGRRNGGDRAIRHSQVILKHVIATGKKTTVEREEGGYN